MSDWLKLKSMPRAHSTPPAPGVLLDVVLSPYDMPEAVRGFRSTNGRFRIEFRYIDGPEPSGPEDRVDAHISAFEGRYTGRLLALEVDVLAMGASAVGISISTPVDPTTLSNDLDVAWRRMMTKHNSPDEIRQLESARAALRSRESEVLSQFAGAG